MSASLWRVGVPRRLLVTIPGGVAEVASLAGRAGLAVHAGQTQHMQLPVGEYAAGTAAGSYLYLVTADRGSYRSQLVTIHLGGVGPDITAVQAFTGLATGVAAAGDRLYVADADRGVRVYDIDTATPAPLGIVEVTP